eukprot:5522043-Lingulodinium_polyedra.AAC.1
MTPKPVIIETPETFQLALLLPRVLLSARHPLDHHDSRSIVQISVARTPHPAANAWLDAFAAMHLL